MPHWKTGHYIFEHILLQHDFMNKYIKPLILCTQVLRYFRHVYKVRTVPWSCRACKVKMGSANNGKVKGSVSYSIFLQTFFLALLYNIKTKHSKIKMSMDTLVTREMLINFTSLNGQMSCNGLSIMVVKQPLWSSFMRIKQLNFYYAMDVAD